MNGLTIKRVQQKLTIKRGAPTMLRVTSKVVSVLKVRASGVRGPRGFTGERGPMGPIGDLTGDVDLPDFVLIFENNLV